MARSRFVPALGAFAIAVSSLVSAQTLGRSTDRPHRPPPTAPDGVLPPCGPTTITQSASQTITPGNSVSCNNAGVHTDNSYWRAFTLADSGIAGALAVCAVQVGVQQAAAGAGQGGLQPVTIRLYTSDPAFPGGTLTPIGSADASVADQSLTVLSIPITALAPAGSQLVVEVFTPSGAAAGNSFFIGSNAETQTGTSYLSAADCGATTPTDVATPGFPNAPDMHIVLNVVGQELLAVPAVLDVDTTGAGNQNGVLEIGETATVAPSWSNPTATIFLLQGAVADFSGAPGPSYVVDDGTADYGAIDGGATANCLAATADCFAVHITGTRPAQHFDAQLTEAPSPGTLAPEPPLPYKVWTLHVGESFDDVTTSAFFYRYVETIFHNGVTGGCSAANYCPGNTVTRAQMAVFLLKAKNGSTYSPPPCTGTVFADVPCAGGLFDPWIEDLAGQGITGGCGGGNYCPGNPVTRAQMSAFLLKTLEGSAYVPPACSGTVFLDVPCTGGIFDPWIEDLAGRAITGGCGGGNYCPGNPNTRGQMAVFLTKTFSLLLYGP